MFCRVARFRNFKSCKYLVNTRYFRASLKCCESISNEIPNTPSDKGGFAKSFEKQTQLLQEEPEIKQTFAALLRNSKLIDVST